jgi:hypothetical protein
MIVLRIVIGILLQTYAMSSFDGFVVPGTDGRSVSFIVYCRALDGLTYVEYSTTGRHVGNLAGSLCTHTHGSAVQVYDASAIKAELEL